MASNAKELNHISYSVQEGAIKYLGVPMHDVDAFTKEMATMFNKGAAFIEECCCKHLSMKDRQRKETKAGVANETARRKKQRKEVPMAIYVHCVAGVHRSAMVVVWWMVQYRKWNLRQAWGTVRNIRDGSCNWRNVTLGGSPEDRKSNWFIGAFNTLVEKELQ